MADFFVVYIAEAHPADGWQTDSNEAEGIRITQPITFEERLAAAGRCSSVLGLTISMLLDGMDDAALRAFAAWPERIFIFDAAGVARYCGGPGPYEFKPDEARTALTALLDSVSVA